MKSVYERFLKKAGDQQEQGVMGRKTILADLNHSGDDRFGAAGRIRTMLGPDTPRICCWEQSLLLAGVVSSNPRLLEKSLFRLFRTPMQDLPRSSRSWLAMIFRRSQPYTDELQDEINRISCPSIRRFYHRYHRWQRLFRPSCAA